MFIYDALDTVVGGAADALGKPMDQIRLVLSLLLNVLLGLSINTIVPPIAIVRHLYCITLGLLMLNYLYSDTWHHVILMSYPVYLMMVFLPRKTQHYYCSAYLALYISG